MRLNPCFAPVLCVLLLLASTDEVSAQLPMPTHGPDWAVPGQYQAAPGQYQPGGNGWIPQMTTMNPATSGAHQSVTLAEDFGVGMQPGAVPPSAGGPPPVYPYPSVSPYDHKFSQTFTEGGLWKSESRDGGRKYFFTLEGFAAELKKPGRHHIGAVLDPDDILNLAAASDINPFLLALRNTQDGFFKHDFKTEGIRGRWGFDNPDRSGFLVEGFWASDVTGSHNLNDDGDITDPTTFQDFNAVPALDGTTTGALIRYDLEFRVRYAAEAFGASMDFLQMPKFGRRTLKIRPMWGLRYLHINEQFSFKGRDSALSYPSTINSINGFPIGVIVDPTTVLANPFGNPPFESFIDSNVWSNLAGPEIGLQFEIGGAKFKIMGHTKFSLLGNAEKISLAGDDFGNGFLIDLNADLNAENFFSQTEYHAHVSPAFEQSLSAEAQIFSIVPVLKKVPALETAVFRVGVTYLTVSEVARPADTIVYQSLPLFPEIEVNRSRWDMYSLNFGVTWRR